MAKKLSSADYREELREDFRWQCAYCGIAETEARGLAFNVEHHTPKAEGGSDDYSNLYWSCWHCNRGKSSWVAGDPYEALRVDVEDPADHLEVASACAREKNYCDCVDSANCVEGITEKGCYNILLLDLNNPALQFVRKARRERAEVDEFIVHGLRQLANVRLDSIASPQRRMQFQRILSSLKLEAESLGVIGRQALRADSWSIHISPASGIEPALRRAELSGKYGARFVRKAGAAMKGASGTDE